MHALRHYPTVFAAFIVTNVIVIIISLIPYLGIFIGIIAAIAFIFVIPLIIIDRRDFFETIEDSFKIVKEKRVIHSYS